MILPWLILPSWPLCRIFVDSAFVTFVEAAFVAAFVDSAFLAAFVDSAFVAAFVDSAFVVFVDV